MFKKVLEVGISDDCILLLDNTERVSGPNYNGGKYVEYRELLKDFEQIHFEHPCVPGVDPKQGNYSDRAGHRVNHRWITTIAYKNNLKKFTTAGHYF